MSTIATILSSLAILCAFGVAGRMDYDDAVMIESAQKQTTRTGCPKAAFNSPPPQIQPAHSGDADHACTPNMSLGELPVLGLSEPAGAGQLFTPMVSR